MAKNIKLNIKNTQIAQAINLTGLKGKLAKKKEEDEAAKKVIPAKPAQKTVKSETEELPKEESPRIRARSRSAFAEPSEESDAKEMTHDVPIENEEPTLIEEMTGFFPEVSEKIKTSAEIREEIFGSSVAEDIQTAEKIVEELPSPTAPISTASDRMEEIKKRAPAPSPAPLIPLLPPPSEKNVLMRN